MIERSLDGAPFAPVSGEVLLATGAPRFRDTGAAPGGPYNYRVIAEDLSGNRSPPSSVSNAIIVP